MTLTELLDALGMQITLEDGELLETAIVIYKAVDDDGTRLGVVHPDGQSWIERYGMLALAAKNVERWALDD